MLRSATSDSKRPLLSFPWVDSGLGLPGTAGPSGFALQRFRRFPVEQEKSLALSFFSVYETFAISWPTVVDAALGRVRKEVCDERLKRWAERIAGHTKIELTVRGREHLDDGATFLVMSNHQSHYDIPVLFHAVGPNIRMITKKELFRIPVFGPALREAGFISIDRQNRASAMESLDVARRLLASGTHVWIAPEGTRSRDGSLLPFKKGGFNLALDSGLPVLPVTLDGTRHMLPADAARSSRGARVRVTFHPPIDPKPYAELPRKEGRDRLIHDVREAIARAL